MGYPTVDLNLFVNAMSRGEADGLKEPSAFSSFVGGAIQGFDAEQKAQAQRDENEIRENQIAQQPVTNRIQAAQADKADAELAGYRSDPEGYAKLQAQKLSNEKAQQEQIEQYNLKQTKFYDIMKGDDSKAKADAVLGGEYTELFDKDPNLIKSVEQNVPTWETSDKDKYWEADRQKRTSALYASQKEKAALTYQKSEDDFNKDTDIGNLANTLGVTRQDLVDKGEVREEYTPKMIRKQASEVVTNPDGTTITKLKFDDKQQPIYEKDGNMYVMEKSPLSTPNDEKMQKNFYYDGKPVFYGMANDTAKTYLSFAETNKVMNNRAKGQETSNNIEAGKEIDKLREKQKADQQQASQMQESEQAKLNDQFTAGASVKVTPQYKAAAAEVDNTVKQNREERTATEQYLDDTGGAKVTESNSVIIPTLSPDRLFNRSLQATINPKATPDASGTFANPNEPAKQIQFQGVTTDEPKWAAEIREKEEIGKAKADMAIQRRAAQNQPISPQKPPPSALVQSDKVSAPAEIPTHFEVLGNTKVPSSAVVDKVLSVPELQDSSAMVLAVAATESHGNVNAESPKVTKNGETLGGVKGIMQVTGPTAEDIAPGVDGTTAQGSVYLGSIRLTSLLKTYDNPMIALIGYNAGPGVAAEAVRLANTTSWPEVKAKIPEAVRKYYSNPDKVNEVLNYADSVMSYFPKFVRRSSDMRMAERLRDNGVLKF